jgi:2-polyprenyl-3-methyl-5-hydroxy-6-metoxy-1,4-benzoquinol methylase
MSSAALEKRISDAHYRGGAEYERSSKRFMRSLVPSERPLRILDVGCGTGLNAAQLTRCGHDVFGIDVSPVAIEKLRAQGINGAAVDIEAESLPLPENTFDLVYASEVIEHCVDTGKFLRNVRAVLKRDGTLLLSTPNSAFWAYRLLGLLGQTASEYQHPGHVRFFSKRSLAATIEDCGFSITAIGARHMYFVLARRIGDPLAPLLEAIGFQKEPRFATGSHFWQLSAFARRASSFWSDTLIVMAHRRGD